MKKRARMDSPAKRRDGFQAPSTLIKLGSSGPLDGPTTQSSTASVAAPGTPFISTQLITRVDDAMNLQNRIHIVENRQQQQYREQVIEQSNHKLMADNIEAVQTQSNDLMLRIDSLESLNGKQKLQEIQAQLSKIKQELESTRKQHQQQMGHVMALVSSTIGSPSVAQRNDGNSDEGQNGDDSTVNEVEQMMLLPLLQYMDFRDPRHLKALKKIEDYEINMSMFHPDEKYNNEGIAYIIRTRGPFSGYIVTSDRMNPLSAEKDYWKSHEWNQFPTVLELSAYRQGNLATPAFPKYVWEIGEIYIQRLVKETNRYTEQSTGYHLVVDITRPEKSIWMVNRCVEHDTYGKIKRNDTKTTDPFWCPFATVANDICDAAIVFANIKDWSGLGTKLGHFKKCMTLVKKTGRNMEPVPTFIKPILGHVIEAIKRGWQTMGPK